MKQSISLFLLVFIAMTSLLAAEDTYPRIKVSGRVLMELHNDNNMTDYHSFEDSLFNDADGYGKGRVDLNFTGQLNANAKAVISTRFESKAGDKWMYFGKAKSVDGDNAKALEKTAPALQEAYIQYDNLFTDGLSFDLGRRSFIYGKKNIVADKDKLDGLHLQYTAGNLFGNLHFIIRDNAAPFTATEDGRDQVLIGINGGMNKIADLINLNVYLWNQGQNYNAAASDEALAESMTVFGFRGDAAVSMFKPYLELALQSGTKEKFLTNGDDLTYSGMLLDLGSAMEMPAGDMKLTGELELLYASGNDASTDDENECWQGVKLGNREEGYKYLNAANYNSSAGMMMIKLNAGLKFNEKTGAALTVWSFNDASKEYSWTKPGDTEPTEFSGKNIYNELNLELSHQLDKTARLYAGVSMLMPNADYPIFGANQTAENPDSATGLYLGTELKF